MNNTHTPLDSELQRDLLGNTVFPRGDQANDKVSKLRVAPVLHSRMRRELLEDLYGVKRLAPSRVEEVKMGLIRDLRRLDYLRNAQSELVSTASPARMLSLANEVRLQPLRPGDRFDCVKNMPVSSETKLQLTTEMGLHSVLDVELLREATETKPPRIPVCHVNPFPTAM